MNATFPQHPFSYGDAGTVNQTINSAKLTDSSINTVLCRVLIGDICFAENRFFGEGGSNSNAALTLISASTTDQP